jgi:hypothetical protein
LTSAKALSALRELPKTNSKLYDEITAGKNTESTAADEPEFSVETEADEGDGSDIPIDVVRLAVMSGGFVTIDGFRTDEQGSIIRTGVAEAKESTELAEVTAALFPVELGRGRRAKTGSKKYGAEWEGH